MPTDDWQRIYEDERPSFAKQSITFSLVAQTYDVVIDPSNPNAMVVRWAFHKWIWPIELVERKDKHHRISGMAVPNEPILKDHAWFELWLDASPKIVYWGDRVVIRTDYPTDA
ncbi:hypothetical protein QTO30_08880 [Yoonia sp. GPGPB17]|uniref:hypothetical protein n=1 Tax=Yoonia sp. GPGPB17 TaxID=3026147 RepID=UPI0030BD4C82